MSYNWDFVGKRKLFFLISAVVLGAGILSLLIQGLNLGIDFKSGTRIDISVKQPVDVEQAKKEFEKLGYEHPSVRSGQEGKVLIFRTDEALDKEKVLQIQKHFRKVYGDNFAGFQEQRIDPVIGRELARNAIIATLLASVGIILYVTIRFDDKASETIVFDREDVLKSTDEILTDNGVRQQASEDLAPVWEKKP